MKGTIGRYPKITRCNGVIQVLSRNAGTARGAITDPPKRYELARETARYDTATEHRVENRTRTVTMLGNAAGWYPSWGRLSDPEPTFASAQRFAQPVAFSKAP